ncbi:MAG: NADH-ubiquinone/plastoquinone oxidoreductase chain 6 [Firmicutes bacterium]|nr:NADH-ubiquinone/plastoquinone oxidoreductase chain 6 [Bacillota bacterium]
MSLNDIVFIALAGITLLAALGVVLSRNIIHSALFLVLTFLGVAGIYFQLNAGFVGLVQIMVYAGAISVLIIFAIMLVMDVEPDQTNLFNQSTPTIMAGGYVSVLLAAGLAGAIWFTKWPLSAVQVGDQGVEKLAGMLLGPYVVSFEVAAILLLVAVFGAILLAKGVEDK